MTAVDQRVNPGRVGLKYHPTTEPEKTTVDRRINLGEVWFPLFVAAAGRSLWLGTARFMLAQESNTLCEGG